MCSVVCTQRFASSTSPCPRQTRIRFIQLESVEAQPQGLSVAHGRSGSLYLRSRGVRPYHRPGSMPRPQPGEQLGRKTDVQTKRALVALAFGSEVVHLTAKTDDDNFLGAAIQIGGGLHRDFGLGIPSGKHLGTDIRSERKRIGVLRRVPLLLWHPAGIRTPHASGSVARLLILLMALERDIQIVIRRKPRSRKAGRISVLWA
jgi:hypothetical protein